MRLGVGAVSGLGLAVALLFKIGCGGMTGSASQIGGSPDANGASGGGGVSSGDVSSGGVSSGGISSGGVAPGGTSSGGTSPDGALEDAPPSCIPSKCQGHVYECGNCLDDDGDGRIDAADPDCLSVCGNSEMDYGPNIPDGGTWGCKPDCFFDQDSGAGNDQCYWSHQCDPLEVAPDYSPEGSKCAYDPNALVPGAMKSCAELMTSQLPECLSFCGPITPNGCDCFGCCDVPGLSYAIWLESEDSSGTPTCSFAKLQDPASCRPCTPVPSCKNACEACELCFGMTELPSGCAQQVCPSGVSRCGLAGQAPCGPDMYCVTGCCMPVPK